MDFVVVAVIVAQGYKNYCKAVKGVRRKPFELFWALWYRYQTFLKDHIEAPKLFTRCLWDRKTFWTALKIPSAVVLGMEKIIISLTEKRSMCRSEILSIFSEISGQFSFPKRRYNFFSTYTKLSEKLTFLTPWYSHVLLNLDISGNLWNQHGFIWITLKELHKNYRKFKTMFHLIKAIIL